VLSFEGHAIVSTDGMIADAAGAYPDALRNDADWRLYQEALDAAAIVVLGRRAHERHPNPGRRRLVVTRSVDRATPDASDPRAVLWNPAHATLGAVLAELGIVSGVVALTGLFDLFVPHYDRFVLSEHHDLVLAGGRPCFSSGHPRAVLAAHALVPDRPLVIDADAMVTTTTWRRRR
jgi:hypothetical protein